jgi:hypothetical protein
MPKPGKLAKATLTEMWPGGGSNPELRVGDREGNADAAKTLTVQFNPETLKVAYANESASGSQPGGSASQFVGKSTTKLSLELWFDAQLPVPEGVEDPHGDVRKLTEQVAYFMTPQSVTRNGQEGLAPPGVQFHWGTFLFKGVVDSMDETLDHFSEDGRPLRAMVALRLSKQDLAFEFGQAGGRSPSVPRPSGAAPAGTTPQSPARQGDTLQQIVARAGAGDWRDVAHANGIENPRILPPGRLLDVSGRRVAPGRPAL